jgi:small subunit ribosomal protein S6
MSTRDYEGLFLLDNNAATADYDAVRGQVDETLKKHGGTVVMHEKWEDRKLAYDIRGHRRGTYYLAYFRSPPTGISRIHEDLGLAETVLRHLILALEEPIETHVQKRTEEREKLAEDSRKQALGGWGDSRRKRERRGRRESDDSGDDGGDSDLDIDPDDFSGDEDSGEMGGGRS